MVKHSMIILFENFLKLSKFYEENCKQRNKEKYIFKIGNK